MDIGRIGPASLGIKFREIVRPGTQAIGSARVHRWTPHIPTPAAFCFEAWTLSKTNYPKMHSRGRPGAAHEIDSAGVPENGEAVDDEDADDLPVLHPTRRQRM
jgi:hypothetical protein